MRAQFSCADSLQSIAQSATFRRPLAGDAVQIIMHPRYDLARREQSGEGRENSGWRRHRNQGIIILCRGAELHHCGRLQPERKATKIWHVGRQMYEIVRDFGAAEAVIHASKSSQVERAHAVGMAQKIDSNFLCTAPLRSRLSNTKPIFVLALQFISANFTQITLQTYPFPVRPTDDLYKLPRHENGAQAQRPTP